MRIAHGLAFAGLLALSACQSGAEPEPPSAQVAGAARILAAIVEAEQTKEGGVDEFDMIVAFRSLNGVGAHFTNLRFCHVVDGSCLNWEIDFTVPPTGVVGFRRIFSSDYNLENEGFTDYFTGVDTRGNRVQVEYSFSTDMLR
jgi:hypothetical protein